MPNKFSILHNKLMCTNNLLLLKLNEYLITLMFHSYFQFYNPLNQELYN